MPQLRALWRAVVATFLVLGCTSASRPATGPDADSYFPMVPGARWVYSLHSNLGTFDVEVTAVGERPLPKDGGAVFVMEERNRGPSLGFVEVAPVGYLVRDGYFARLAGVDYDDVGALRVLGEDGPTWMLPLDPTPGRVWGQRTRIFQSPEGGGAELGWSGEVKPRTVVSVPAGRFEDVVEIETSYRDVSDGIAATMIYHDYYARGVGLVKSVSVDPSGDSSNQIEQVLVEYHLDR